MQYSCSLLLASSFIVLPTQISGLIGSADQILEDMIVEAPSQVRVYTRCLCCGLQAMRRGGSFRLINSRHCFAYDPFVDCSGSFSSDVGGMYSSSYGGDYMTRGSNV